VGASDARDLKCQVLVVFRCNGASPRAQHLRRAKLGIVEALRITPANRRLAMVAWLTYGIDVFSTFKVPRGTLPTTPPPYW
jgi:hypothetical protein